MRIPLAWNDEELLGDEPFLTSFLTFSFGNSRRSRSQVIYNQLNDLADALEGDEVSDLVCSLSSIHRAIQLVAAEAWARQAFASFVGEGTTVKVPFNKEIQRVFVHFYWKLSRYNSNREDAVNFLRQERMKRGFLYTPEKLVKEKLKKKGFPLSHRATNTAKNKVLGGTTQTETTRGKRPTNHTAKTGCGPGFEGAEVASDRFSAPLKVEAAAIASLVPPSSRAIQACQVWPSDSPSVVALRTSTVALESSTKLVNLSPDHIQMTTHDEHFSPLLDSDPSDGEDFCCNLLSPPQSFSIPRSSEDLDVSLELDIKPTYTGQYTRDETYRLYEASLNLQPSQNRTSSSTIPLIAVANDTQPIGPKLSLEEDRSALLVGSTPGPLAHGMPFNGVIPLPLNRPDDFGKIHMKTEMKGEPYHPHTFNSSSNQFLDRTDIVKPPLPRYPPIWAQVSDYSLQISQHDSLTHLVLVSSGGV
ncbi:hypothetical protein H0H87_010133 [Tephrocybe sp. NHM501043]|nr:hypothetical protein H0H87_010133 [Tephrocybe sp. NHM501043]